MHNGDLYSNLLHMWYSHIRLKIRTILADLLDDGILNEDGDNWKFQRQVSSHEFNTKSLRKFVEQVVDTELSDRLIPILSASVASSSVLDFQDILQRFGFDNICQITFRYYLDYLLPSLPEAKFVVAFDDAVQISGDRFRLPHPVWKLKRALGIGSERRLRAVVSEVGEFAKTIVRENKRDLSEAKALESVDLLSRFLSSGHTDEKFVTDIVISFILAGRDTTLAALTWFFWLLSQNPRVKEMVYTHIALCESMRLYPSVPTDSKQVANDDVLPDGTKVKKGMTVTYQVYAMGRMEEIWGADWAEYRPERWLEREERGAHKWKFVGRDTYSYPVFQAGPRICLGKEMAFLQMKRVVSAV
ncbi:cytochrome P450 94A1-like [Pyrus ussuriensis x Pyrus communis]|uniref:Cytochrome P450 94A1-like n=1 Tax=Pyrus ussuriensis x Pyrus communis TaxID=2448454 RepID=A0A5N5FGZ8_9ROSA|nr:cytochrome P450 94A1-like [Pyrus ussuriensis x Pyrus communis]